MFYPRAPTLSRVVGARVLAARSSPSVARSEPSPASERLGVRGRSCVRARERYRKVSRDIAATIRPSFRELNFSESGVTSVPPDPLHRLPSSIERPFSRGSDHARSASMGRSTISSLVRPLLVRREINNESQFFERSSPGFRGRRKEVRTRKMHGPVECTREYDFLGNRARSGTYSSKICFSTSIPTFDRSRVTRRPRDRNDGKKRETRFVRARLCHREDRFRRFAEQFDTTLLARPTDARCFHLRWGSRATTAVSSVSSGSN